MKRRDFLVGGAALAGAGTVLAQALTSYESYDMPPRFTRPDIASDEGGLWAIMDRQETVLRRSPLTLKDPALKAYLQGLACRLGGEHCPDIRVHLVRNPNFNAAMAPNGMMQLWTGLLLRVDNEAQLAAVLAHEIAHYLQRHSVQQLRDLKSKTAFAQFIGVFGLIGAIGSLAAISSVFAYSREHENEADAVGAFLMHRAGYEVGEASAIWRNLSLEIKGRESDGLAAPSALFATHPLPPERLEKIAELAKILPGGEKNEVAYHEQTRRSLQGWYEDEVKRGQHGESLALFTRKIESRTDAALALAYRGEVYRLRGNAGDAELARADYASAAEEAAAPAVVYRGLGLIARQLGDKAAAAAALARYLELAPTAADYTLIQSYLADLSS